MIMTQEEKARAYDKAIEKIKYVIGHNISPTLNKEDLQDLFPELQKSEDERIRKEIIAFIKSKGQHIDKYEWHKWIAWLKKQGEQTPDDKVEPKFHEGDWIIHQGTENVYKVVAVIDNQYQLKYGDTYTIQNCVDVDRCARLYDVAKDSKNKEWSEEDEKCIRLSIDIIDSALRAGFCVQLDRDRCVDWLKSLKPKKQWKPTKGQMKALHDLNLTGNISYVGQGPCLLELYNKLKEL